MQWRSGNAARFNRLQNQLKDVPTNAVSYPEGEELVALETLLEGKDGDDCMRNRRSSQAFRRDRSYSARA